MSGNKVDFDRIARPYRWLEYLTFGTQLEHCREQFLKRLAGCRRALVLGDGDGRFLAALMKMNPAIHADAVDTSGAMLQLLRRRCEAVPWGGSRLRTYTGPAPGVFSGTYDLIVTHFFLDCLRGDEVEALIGQVVQQVTPGALWVLSDFRIPAGPARYPAWLLVRALYLAFRLLTGLRTSRLPDYASPLMRAGFVRIAQQQRLAGMLTSELWQFQMPVHGAMAGEGG